MRGAAILLVALLALTAQAGTVEITIAPERMCTLNEHGFLTNCVSESAEGSTRLEPMLDICDCGDPDSAACAADCDDEITQCDDHGGVTECEVLRTRDGSVAVAIAQCGDGVTAVFAKECGG